MASDVSTIQSLKAVDAWIDVINANINGGVRTAFKASRLKFGGSNTIIDRSGNATSLPLQFPEPALTTANTLIDWTQGAITASTENTHLAIQGDGFFTLMNPAFALPNGGHTAFTAGATTFLVTREGEFHTNAQGFLVHSSGWYLCAADTTIRLVYNDLDLPPNSAVTSGVRLSDFAAQSITATSPAGDGVTPIGVAVTNIWRFPAGKQQLQYSQFGSAVFDYGYRQGIAASFAGITKSRADKAQTSILTKSLEASNASMTQSVPELSLAQKLFSALTKVLQTKQTNVDGVLNLVR